MVKAASSNESWQHLYRALLRSSAASVRFCRPATRNTRRYLRDEFAGAQLADPAQSIAACSNSAGGSTNDAAPRTVAKHSSPKPRRMEPLPKDCSVGALLRQQAHNTLAFHLSASLLTSNAPRNLDRTEQLETHSTRTSDAEAPTKQARLAHRIISNLSSLTYHHLSPYTQMQSGAHLRSNRALRKPKKLSSLARVLGKVEADLSLEGAEAGLKDVLDSSRGSGYDGEETLNAAHMKLGFLIPTVKPVRGPLSARLKEWDGQDASKIASEGNLRQMEADLGTIERLVAEHNASVGNKATMAKQLQQLKVEAEQLKKKIKSMSRSLAQTEDQKELENVPVEHLANLIAAAQESEHILLGKNRWTRRKNGAFLPP